MELDQRQIGRAQIHALRDLLGEQYTSVVDLSRTRGKPDAQPLSALEQIADRHEGTYTDVLIFRSPFGDEEERVTVEPIEDPAHREEGTPERDVEPEPEYVPAKNLLTSRWARS
jgi:hypothetical protein